MSYENQKQYTRRVKRIGTLIAGSGMALEIVAAICGLPLIALGIVVGGTGALIHGAANIGLKQLNNGQK